MANAGIELAWRRSVLFSAISTGIHMKLSTSNAAGPMNGRLHSIRHLYGMVHRSALSPDGMVCWWKWIASGGDDAGSFRSTVIDGKAVGPQGSCTWASVSRRQWMISPWILGRPVLTFAATLPDGAPQQLTHRRKRGRGVAIMPDGKSFVVPLRTQRALAHDERFAIRLIASPLLACA